MGWDAIDAGLDPHPVAGNPDHFLDAGNDVTAASDAVLALARHVDSLLAPMRAGWRGAGADALSSHGVAIVAALGDVGPVLAGVGNACARHAAALAGLHAEAAAALALANERYGAHQLALSRLDAAQRAAAATERDLAVARTRSEPGPELAAAEARHAARLDDVAQWRARLGLLACELSASRATHAALREAEAMLDAATREALASARSGLTAEVARESVGGAAGGSFARIATARAALAAAAGRALDAALAYLAAALTERLLPFPFQGHALLGAWQDTLAQLPDDRQWALVAALADLHGALGSVDRHGDPGGTYDWATRGSWPGSPPAASEPSDAAGRGAGLIAEALRLTDGARWLAPDEFGVVELDAGRYVVVLPGVTDLSNPDLGHDAQHRTVRDVDQAAIGSSLSTGSAGNPYARMVAEGLTEFGVEPGSQILIVGHSFGADTALDLAADPAFNGPTGYAVTHVVAAGYHSRPQLGAVPDATEVLVLQNTHDWVVAAERFGEHPVAAAAELGDAWHDLGDGNLLGVAAALSNAGREAGEFAAYLATDGTARDRGVPPRIPLPGWPTGRPRSDARVTTPAEHQLVAVFDGGDAGWGHHQSNYIEYVRHQRDPRVSAFARAVDGAGYTGTGHVVAIDVSVPAGRNGSGSW